jgi:hypothetical protein
MSAKDLYKKLKINVSARQAVFISLFIIFLLCMPSVTFVVKAADIIVDDDPLVGDYQDIQTAINNAAPGDTIWVRNGSYNEQLTVNVADLTIIADNGATPIIYVTSFSPGIDITAADVAFDGFKIYGNSNPLGGPTLRASGGADRLEIRDNQFVALTDEIGTNAILIATGATEVQIKDNVIRSYERGVTFQAASNGELSGNSFLSVNHSVSHAAQLPPVVGITRCFGDIQSAITAALSRSIITVNEGTYLENIVIDRSVTLQGVKSNVNPTVAVRSGDESVINGGIASAIRIATSVTNVTIKGFTFTIPLKNPGSNEAGILIGSSTENILISNNIFEDITDGSGADTINDETYGIMVYGRTGTGQRGITITKNLIQNVEEYGIAINDNTSDVVIKDNTIKELIGSDHSGDTYFDPAWPDRICSCIHLGGQVGPIRDILIEGNILFTNVTGDGSTGFAGGGVSFGGVAEWSPGTRPWNGFQNVVVSYNEIVGNSMGIVGLAGSSDGTIEVQQNNISGNTQYGLYNIIPDAEFNATNDWWGHISGPYSATDNPDGLGDTVVGNATFWPWQEFSDVSSSPPIVNYDVGLPFASGGLYVSTTTQITITATDAQSGMYSLQYRIWDTVNRWSPWKDYTEKITLSGEGKHMVEYNATDNAGQKTQSTRIHYVDTKAPEVTVLYPNGDEYIRGPVTIKWKAADKILDQEQTEWNNSISLTEDYPGHIQSFIPTEDTIRSVQLLLDGDDANVSIKLFSQIYPIPTPMAQSSQHLRAVGNPQAPVWIDFPFDSDVDINPGSTYYIGVTQEIYGNTGFKWYYYDSYGGNDIYHYGHGWLKQTDLLVNKSEWDFGFRTLFWDTGLGISVQYSMTGVSPWSTLAENEYNDGSYTWDTSLYPDGESYRVRVVASDEINNLGGDSSDKTFTVDNEGPSITEVVITDTTVDSIEYIKDGDNVEITATIMGDPKSITADLSNLGKGTAVEPDSYLGSIAHWYINDVTCVPSNGPLTVKVTATDQNDDSSYNQGTIIADNLEPTVVITRPGPGLYIMDSMRLLPFAYPFVIGQITVIADAADDGSGVDHVEFYLENDLETIDTEPPYSWLWDRAATGFFNVEVIAYDAVGHSVSDQVLDLFIINFDIWG